MMGGDRDGDGVRTLPTWIRINKFYTILICDMA